VHQLDNKAFGTGAIFYIICV